MYCLFLHELIPASFVTWFSCLHILYIWEKKIQNNSPFEGQQYNFKLKILVLLKAFPKLNIISKKCYNNGFNKNS